MPDAVFATQPGRRMGRPFVKGKVKTGGRPKGGLNVTTRNAKECIAEACRLLGDVQRLVEWAMEDPVNERIFWSQIWTRLIPVTVHGAGPRGEIEHSLTLTTREDVLKALAERNLPSVFFGYDKPSLPEPKVIEAPMTNGAGHQSAEPNGSPRLSED
jgi:hypothetical protein